MRRAVSFALAATLSVQPALGFELSTPPGSGGGGGGGVSSVGVALPDTFTCTGSPVTGSGTITCSYGSEAANTFFAAPNGSAGAPGFRALAMGDLPSVANDTIYGNVSGGSAAPVALSAAQVSALLALGTAATKNASGSGSSVASTTGSFTAGHCLEAGDANGTVEDAGAICGSGGSGIDQLTGDVTAGPGTGAQAATIAGGAVTLAKMATLAADSLIGNNTGSNATPLALTPAQVQALLLYPETTGSFVSGDCVKVSSTISPVTFEDAGAACGSGGGSGTVNSGTQYQLGYYAATGTAMSGAAAIATNGSGNLVVGSGLIFNIRAVASGTSDTAGAGDRTIAWNSSSAAAKTETIPNCSSAIKGQIYVIADEIGTAGTYSITVSPASSGTISGGSSAVLSANYASLTLQCDGGTNWLVE